MYENEPQLTPADGSSAIAPDTVAVAMRGFLSIAAADPRYDPATNPQFRYDLIDIVRQVACDVSHDLAALRGAEYMRYMSSGENTTAAFLATSAALRELLAAVDALLATDVNFLGMGNWLQDATSWAPAGNRTVSDWLSFNARNQVTQWGPTGQINDCQFGGGCVQGAPVPLAMDAPPAYRSHSSPSPLHPCRRRQKLVAGVSGRVLRRAVGAAHGHAGGGAGSRRAARLGGVPAGAPCLGAGMGAQHVHQRLPHDARGQHA